MLLTRYLQSCCEVQASCRFADRVGQLEHLWRALHFVIGGLDLHFEFVSDSGKCSLAYASCMSHARRRRGDYSFLEVLIRSAALVPKQLS